jgi:hypothetical protein
MVCTGVPHVFSALLEMVEGHFMGLTFFISSLVTLAIHPLINYLNAILCVKL